MRQKQEVIRMCNQFSCAAGKLDQMVGAMAALLRPAGSPVAQSTSTAPSRALQSAMCVCLTPSKSHLCSLGSHASCDMSSTQDMQLSMSLMFLFFSF